MVDIPKFKSVDEMMAFEKKMRSQQKSSDRKTQKENKREAIKSASDDALIYEVLHLYTRPGDNFQAVKKDGQTRYRMSPDNFWVHVHNHSVIEDCTKSCDWLERVDNG